MVRNGFCAAACIVFTLLAGCGTAPSPATPQRQIIDVSTAEEFVRAIGPDRTIRLAPGEYVLSDVKDRHLPHVRWYPEFDGNSLTVRDVKGMTIEGVGPQPVRVVVRPKYVFVLAFHHCENIELRNLVLGHAPDKGQCTSGVIGAEHCRGLRIIDCDLFGCGTEGLTLEDVHGLRMENAIIRDCSYGILTMESCSDITFTRSRFTGNEEFHGFVINDCRDVVFSDCVVEKNKAAEPLFQVVSSSDIHFRGGAIRGNKAMKLMERDDHVRIEGAAVENNTYDEALAESAN